MAEPPPREPRDPADDETIVRDEWGPETVVVEEDTPLPPRRPRLWPWLLALLLLVLGGIAAAWFLTRDDDEDPGPTTTAELVEVPLLVGLREEPARDRLDEAGLVGDIERRPAERPRGVVVEQEPQAGEELERGDEVRLVVSDGRREQTTGDTTTTAEPESARVPEVVGMSSSDATDVLREAGFDVRLVPVPSQEPSGTVVGQMPAAGAQARKGSEVRLNVAQQAEPEPAVVPDVVGLELADAARSFAQEGLKVAVRYVPSDEPQGRVVAQAQAAGTERQRGDTVQLNVSTRADPAERTVVPRATGGRLDRGRAALEAAGLEVLALTIGEGEVRNESTVGSQSPAANALIPRGSLVLLYVTG